MLSKHSRNGRNKQDNGDSSTSINSIVVARCFAVWIGPNPDPPVSTAKAESNHGAGIDFWGATSRFTNFFRKFLNFGPEKPLLTIVQGSIFQESIPELSKIVQE